MMHLLSLEQSTPFAFWISQSAYPVIITLHSIGMALLVGLLTLISLRVLGAARALPLPSLRRYMKWVWIGFWINACSGTALFLISPVKFLHSGLFISKLSFITGGLIFGAIMNSMVLKTGDEYSSTEADQPATAKTLAVLSLVCWLCAIISGRLLAYSTFADVGIGGGG